MNWIKIEDPSNLPFGDVLATVENPGQYRNGEVLVGYLVYDKYISKIKCECDSVALIGVTHYIKISDIPRPI
jgi:hypothetical protein